MRYKLASTILGATIFAGAAFAQAPADAAFAQAPADAPASPDETEMDAAAAPSGGTRPSRPEDGMRRADTNKDGKISFDELHALRPETTPERFKTLDSNGDGFLGPEDRPAGNRGKARAAAGADFEARRQLMDKLMSTDTNQDGKASYAEVAAAKPGYAKTDFDRVDRDRDGFITAADSPRPPQANETPKKPGTAEARGGREARMTPEQREQLRERLRKADANSDGFVTREEARTGLPNVTDARFKNMDRNGDGKLGPDDGPAGGATRPN